MCLNTAEESADPDQIQHSTASLSVLLHSVITVFLGFLFRFFFFVFFFLLNLLKICLKIICFNGVLNSWFTFLRAGSKSSCSRFRKSNNHVPQENIAPHTFINIFSSEVTEQMKTVCAEGTIFGPQEVVNSI